jgi:hypothetical protein
LGISADYKIISYRAVFGLFFFGISTDDSYVATKCLAKLHSYMSETSRTHYSYPFSWCVGQVATLERMNAVVHAQSRGAVASIGRFFGIRTTYLHVEILHVKKMHFSFFTDVNNFQLLK